MRRWITPHCATLVAWMAQAWFGGDLGISPAIAANVAIAAQISAVLFLLARKPNRRAMEAVA